jgi:hypothetical protein
MGQERGRGGGRGIDKEGGRRDGGKEKGRDGGRRMHEEVENP